MKHRLYWTKKYYSYNNSLFNWFVQLMQPDILRKWSELLTVNITSLLG